MNYKRQDNEPAQWYDRFTRYRLLGPMRSIRGAYVQDLEANKPATEERIASSGNLKAPHLWYDVSKEWRWKQRAEAWDEENRQALIEADRVAREEWRLKFLSRQRNLVDELTAKAEQMLQFKIYKEVDKVTIDADGNEVHKTLYERDDWRLRDIPYLVDVLNRVGRLAAGESTDNVKQIGVTLEDVLDALPAELGEKVREELAQSLSEDGDAAAIEP